MTARRVLVTGAGGDLGAALVRMLCDDPAIRSVVAVDAHSPREDLGRADVVRADIRNPLIARVIAAAEIDTVVHTGVLSAALLAGDRAAIKEANVLGTMPLLAACQRSASVRTLVVTSTTSVYGRSPRDPAIVTESGETNGAAVTGYARDAGEVEDYVRGFGRRRPDVTITVLRLTNLIGPGLDSALTRYFGLPVAPTILGADPRLQMIHSDDALAVLRLALDGRRPGTFNVGGDGVLLLSQALRRLGRPSVAVPALTGATVGRALRLARAEALSPEHLTFLGHDRVVDTSALRERFGYTPRFSTAAAFEDYAAVHPGPLRTVPLFAFAESAVAGMLERRRLARA